MLVKTATLGWNVSVPSSWKLEASRTKTVSPVEPSTRPETAWPMFPPTLTSRPASRSMAPRAAVVVDFPLVPVTATTSPARCRNPSSSSAITGTPARRAAWISGRSKGTPGDTTTSEAPVNVASRWPPSSSRTPLDSILRTSASSSIAGFRSVATTGRPRPARSVAAAIPDRASPTTTTGFPSTSMAIAFNGRPRPDPSLRSG
jgi:hypothetical protein